MAEQRAHPRYAIELDASLELEGARTLHGRTQDISRGGFCMQVPSGAPVKAGTPGTVRLALVFSENEFSEQLALEGSVAWCTPLKTGMQVGVRFEALDAQARSYLELFIRFLEEGREDEAEPAEE